MKEQVADKSFVKFKNKKMYLHLAQEFLEENLLGLAPYFGRGDLNYNDIEKDVVKNLKISGLKM